MKVGPAFRFVRSEEIHPFCLALNACISPHIREIFWSKRTRFFDDFSRHPQIASKFPHERYEDVFIREAPKYSDLLWIAKPKFPDFVHLWVQPKHVRGFPPVGIFRDC